MKNKKRKNKKVSHKTIHTVRGTNTEFTFITFDDVVKRLDQLEYAIDHLSAEVDELRRYMEGKK